jgi:PadR family transcriptional regulator PadR
MPLPTNNQPATEKNKFKGLGKGYIRWIVLALLCDKPYSGYELQQEIADTLEGWRPSPGTLYPLLHELNQQKLITGQPDEKEGRRRIKYKIKPKGQAQLEAAATQHLLFVSAMRKILGKHGSPRFRKRPSFQMNHILPKMHKDVKMILDEVHLLPKELESDPEKALQHLQNRLQYLEEHAKCLQTAITRVQKHIIRLKEHTSKIIS